MDGFDGTQLANIGQRTRSAMEQADVLANGTVGGAAISTVGNSIINDIGMAANDYVAGQQQQANWFGTATDLAGMGVSTFGAMNFGNKSGADLYGFDPAGSQGNPFGIGAKPTGLPGGPAFGGGRVPLNG